jgi:hypothetical protein
MRPCRANAEAVESEVEEDATSRRNIFLHPPMYDAGTQRTHSIRNSHAASLHECSNNLLMKVYHTAEKVTAMPREPKKHDNQHTQDSKQ